MNEKQINESIEKRIFYYRLKFQQNKASIKDMFEKIVKTAYEKCIK